ncbi:MAG: hypothetical protein ACI9N0_001225 [Ilumatobacter sp.]
MAIIRPPLEHCAHLEPPLNAGEQHVLEHLNQLSDEWTIYVQPRLGQDVPDFVAVHNTRGVCAIEVKDWSYSGYRQADNGCIEYITGDGVWHASKAQPRYQAYRYRSTIYEHFFALPDDGSKPTNAVRAVVIFPNHSTEHARRLLAHHQVTSKEESVDIFGGDDLKQSLKSIVYARDCKPPRAASMTRLRRHLVESEVVSELRLRTQMSSGAKNIETNPSAAKQRRVKGPAGCGKSFGLAARAAHLAANGKSVLVLSFNITLAHYLRMLVTARCKESGADPTLVTTTSFHSFCTRTVQDAEVDGFVLDEPTGVRIFDVGIAKAQQAFDLGFKRQYDAVLVDEGQDFTLDWWNMLRHHVVADDGEMLLVADPTQDVYEKQAWTDEEKMIGAGFSGGWTHLLGSYRLPSDLIPMANDFAANYLDGEYVAGAVPPDRLEISGTSGATRRRWTNLDGPIEIGRAIGTEVIRLLAEHPELSPNDIVFLCEKHRDGLAAVQVIEDAGHQVHHVFSEYKSAQTQRKQRFWPDAAGIKGCTVHSFKGWETQALVMGIGTDRGSRRLAYVAMTRVKTNIEGGQSFLSVVNGDVAIAGFESTFTEWAKPLAAMRLG